MANNSRILFAAPNVDETDIQSVIDTIINGWIAPIGPELDQFEAALVRQFKYNNVLVVNSGTSALHLAVRLAGVRQGDHVVVGSFTFISAANAVIYEGGTPVFMDSEPDTWNLDPELLEVYLQKTENTDQFPKAVLVTHIFGIPAKIEEIKSICDKYSICLIEDAAEAVGSKVGETYLGSFGDFGVLSFNGNKILTTSGGGALICKEEAHHTQAKHLATLAREPADHYLYKEIGYNYRLSNVLAGLGLSQLQKIEEYLTRKRSIANEYQEAFSSMEWIDFAPVSAGSNHWVNPFLIKPKYMAQVTPSKVIQHLDRHNIEGRRFWLPLHMQPLYTNSDFIGEGVCEDLFHRGFCLPSGTGLTGKEVSRVINAIEELNDSISI